MQINIRFNDQNKPININCKCGVILEHIRKCANLDSSLLLDLSDKDGNVKLLRPNLTTYATQFLSAGETYYLVSATEDPKQYTYKLLATLTPEEGTIDVKPTKPDKKDVAKKPPPKPASRAKKPGK
ncbi:hypothetical protein TVAG_246210 [Trichomonas vaginalis G3]|uniref:Uncharacterized protein n=1 Tax=Trichomonas vaginalis (strain ATCC PRA-98 / G3) TaxID=412133 RepID=A2E4S7_TRIV3|nr:putative interleukin 2 receptor, gamma chain [Trichomonas vaginalis G3]EAY12387.1 hypothetical protein TVAG_246210 [Trichomonas vaginalis G3]KAI5500804.1 putative interleukin 2 receptor, gamma chain [Trichomonas vaginalis G3]|eukprot:XP_001324610.1 hypothetical protein [Trichomonas vaginalis G3]